MTETPRTACHREGEKCLGDPLAEALGDSMVATDRPYTWRDLSEGHHSDLLYRAERVRASLAARGLRIEAEAAQDAARQRDELREVMEGLLPFVRVGSGPLGDDPAAIAMRKALALLRATEGKQP